MFIISHRYNICYISNNICTNIIPYCHAQEPASDIWAYADLGPLITFVENAIEHGVLQYDPLIPVSATPSREVFERVRARWEGQH